MSVTDNRTDRQTHRKIYTAIVLEKFAITEAAMNIAGHDAHSYAELMLNKPHFRCTDTIVLS